MYMIYTCIAIVLSTATGYKVCKYAWNRSIQLNIQDLERCRAQLIQSADYDDNIEKQQEVQDITELLAETKKKV